MIYLLQSRMSHGFIDDYKFHKGINNINYTVSFHFDVLKRAIHRLNYISELDHGDYRVENNEIMSSGSQ